jgi:hypothetical protein
MVSVELYRINCIVSRFPFLVLNGHHHRRVLNVFSVYVYILTRHQHVENVRKISKISKSRNIYDGLLLVF